MKVYSYLVYVNAKYRQPPDGACAQFVSALKGHKEIRGSITIKSLGAIHQLVSANQLESFGFFARWAHACIDMYVSTPHVTLVPIPSKKNISGSPKGLHYSTAALMASHLAVSLGRAASIADVIRWTKELKSAKDGGPREPEKLYKHLSLEGSPPVDLDQTTIILIDDVITKGGHMKACRYLLEKEWGCEVEMGLCGAQTTMQIQRDELFNKNRYWLTKSLDLEDWKPIEDTDNDIPF